MFHSHRQRFRCLSPLPPTPPLIITPPVSRLHLFFLPCTSSSFRLSSLMVSPPPLNLCPSHSSSPPFLPSPPRYPLLLCLVLCVGATWLHEHLLFFLPVICFGLLIPLSPLSPNPSHHPHPPSCLTLCLIKEPVMQTQTARRELPPATEKKFDVELSRRKDKHEKTPARAVSSLLAVQKQQRKGKCCGALNILNAQVTTSSANRSPTLHHCSSWSH